MDANKIASNLERDRSILSDDREKKLRAVLQNIIICLDMGYVEKRHICRLIKVALEKLDKSEVPSYASVHAAFLAAHLNEKEDSHYLRPIPLIDWCDCRAVTVVSDQEHTLGNAWKMQGARGSAIADAAEDGTLKNVHVGIKGRALWITPYRGEIEALCEAARKQKRFEPDLNATAARVAAKLGLTPTTGEDLIAFVTQKTIGELGFDHPGLGTPAGPVGPTVLEARAHTRFRPWPPVGMQEGYGRTYDRDKAARAADRIERCYGAREATRPRLPINEFTEVIYLGRIVSELDDDDDDFLKEIDAKTTAAELLAALGARLGL